MQIEASGSVDLNRSAAGRVVSGCVRGLCGWSDHSEFDWLLGRPVHVRLLRFSIGIYSGHPRGRSDLAPSLLGVTLSLGVLVLGSVAILCICGKVEVRVCGTQARIFTGMGPIGWRRSFDWSGVASVRITQTFMRNGDAGQCWIELDGPRRLRFGTLLTEPRCHFVANVLKLKLVSGSQNTGPPDC
jgi:hypothetical protein